MKKIPVQSYVDGLVYAIVDDEDFDMLCGYSWHVKARGSKGRYVATVIYYWSLEGKEVRREVKMHHAVIGQPPIGMDTHHINGDVLDNRKCNLEFIDSLIHGHISSRQAEDTI